MSKEDFARALHEAVQASIRELERTGRTDPPARLSDDIKGKLAREYPREFQHAIDVSIWYNDGVFDDDVFAHHLDTIRGHYKDRLDNKDFEKE